MSFIVKYSYPFLLYPIFVLWYILAINTSQPVLPERLIFLHLLLYSLAFFLPSKILRSVYISVVYISTLLLIFFEAAFALIYKDTITYSIVYILLETNVSEAGQYLDIYFSGPVFRLMLILLIPSVLILIAVNKAIFKYNLSDYFGHISNRIKLSKTAKKLSALGLLILGTVIYINAGHFKHHLVNKMIIGYELYCEESLKYKDFLASSEKSPLMQSVVKQEDSLKKTLIVLIGEATVRDHLGIYGYYRNTTPKLKRIENELVVFNDVVSPHANTISSLEKVLTFASVTHPNDKSKGSIVQLVKNAGYKTFWISNQIPLGVFETLVTMIGKTSDQSYFINMGSAEVQSSYDENLFPFIQKALDDNTNKKVIFVHILGTHSVYSWRYPKDYDVFSDRPRTNFPSEKSTLAVNTYDNAVLYNDFVVYQIINMLKNNAQEGEEQHFIYFSDHGEELYQSTDFEGHAEQIATHSMFEIPFIYWSNQTNKIAEYINYADRKYMTDDIIYSTADLLNIQFDGMKPENSIFSSHFVPKPRKVRNDLDYDKEIKTQFN